MANRQHTPESREPLWWLVVGVSAALVVLAALMMVVAGAHWYSLMLLTAGTLNLGYLFLFHRRIATRDSRPSS
jgi:hypothetical protein